MVASLVYKGKATNRSWSQLPPELVRAIAFRFLEVSLIGASWPSRWQGRDYAHQRRLFIALREARILETMMKTCNLWGLAIKDDPFWHHLLMLFDPRAALNTSRLAELSSHEHGSSAMAELHLPPYHHYCRVISISCVVCRLASPYTNMGLAAARASCYGMHTGSMYVCNDHSDKYCGVCLYGQVPTNGYCAEPNNDETSFPHVEAVCHRCREDCFRSAIADNPDECNKMQQVQSDLQAEISITHYVMDGEGTVESLLKTLRERIWLTENTRIADFAAQALAASKYEAEGAGSEMETDFSDSEEESLEDDSETLNANEDRVRATALDDWARRRILGGHWLSPADVWYNHKPLSCLNVDVPSTKHPCPWSLEDYDNEPRPTPTLLNSTIPPSYTLCEQAFFAHGRMMRSILFPAMHNIVRKIVIGCGVSGKDPAMIAARMSLDDVLKELHDEMTWYEEVDWLARWENENFDAMNVDHKPDSSPTTFSEMEVTIESSDLTTPLESDSSLDTAFSTTPLDSRTIQSSPSSRSASVSPSLYRTPKESPSTSIPPHLDQSRLIFDIPFIPVTSAHFPQYTYESVRAVWREACSPLYQCQCSTCERANGKTQDANQAPKLPKLPGLFSLDEVIDLTNDLPSPSPLITRIPKADIYDREDVFMAKEEEEEEWGEQLGIEDFPINIPESDEFKIVLSSKERPNKRTLDLETNPDDPFLALHEETPAIETAKRPRHT